MSQNGPAGKKCILVLGMHRSGTSLIARMSSLLGAALPSTLMSPNDFNVAGYWESLPIVEINDRLLAEAGSRWDDWRAFDSSALPTARMKHYADVISQAIASEFGNAEVVILKDPRISRFAPLYIRLLEGLGFEVLCLHMTRNPRAVAASLLRRDNLPEAHGELLWLRHELDAEFASRGKSRIFMSYDEAVRDGEAVAMRLRTWLEQAGITLPKAESHSEIAALVQAQLRHFVVDDLVPMAMDARDRLLSQSYQALRRLETDPEDAAALDELDGSRVKLDLVSEVTGAAYFMMREKSEQNATDVLRCQESEAKLRRDFERALAESRGNDAEIARLRASREHSRQDLRIARRELLEARAEAEGLRAELSEAVDAKARMQQDLERAESEADEMRKLATKFLRSPLVPLGENLRFRASRQLSRLVRPLSVSAAEKYARSAEKRNPKRLVNAKKTADRSRKVLLSGQSERPGIAGSAKGGGSPMVILPFDKPLSGVGGPVRIAVILHAYYIDQTKIYLKYLRNIPVPFSLFVSTDSEEKAAFLTGVFADGPAEQTVVRVMPNRGRDIAPKLVGFGNVHAEHDLVLHLHTKASYHNDQLSSWRDFILDALLGSPEIVASVLEAFASSPRLGMIAPPNYHLIRPYMGWSVNFEHSRALGKRIGVEITLDSPLDFPAGSMFWARSEALQPLLDSGITLEDFPEETGQTDATFAHAVERLYFYSCERAGLRWFHAGQRDQLVEADHPLRIARQADLDWALSDLMPAVLLPGRRPQLPAGVNHNPEARLARIKDAFRSQCDVDLAQFLASGERLKFAPPGDAPRVSIVLVLYNQAELTFHCLESLRRNAGMAVEIVIIDNGSTDDTARLLERLDGVTILQNDENLHFLRGVNRAAQAAHGEFLLLLNNDARVLPGTIPAAVLRLDEEPDIGAVGGPITLLDGTLQEAGSIIFSDGACLGYGRGRDPGEVEFRFQRDVDYCSGAFLMLRRALWEDLGGFDEAYVPAYYEETDLCMRIRESGSRVVYDPDVRIVHFEFGSSASSQQALDLQQRNRGIFVSRHQAALSNGHLPLGTPPIQARERRNCRGHLLVVDDRFPDPSLGAGYPRAAQILQDAAGAGWSVTLYPLVIPFVSCDRAYGIVPRTVELTIGRIDASLQEFLHARIGCFDTILVSRPHNMDRFRAAIGHVPGYSGVPILYDAEALFADRTAMLARLQGRSCETYAADVTREITLSDNVRTVFSVSEDEARKFRNHGRKDVRVLAHALTPRPLGNGPEGRKDMLFVGALDDEISPNTDSLLWFVTEIMPLIDSRIGTDWCLNVAGRAGSGAVRELATPRVRILGRIEDLDQLYALSRLLIAPTRYAAGIPMKVHESASVGLPAVVTDALARQLGWQDQKEVLSASTAEDFAAACARLWSDDALWFRLRNAALAAVTRDCSPALFRRTLVAALDGSAE